MHTSDSYVDFNNLEIAFRDKSNAELRQAHLLFRLMNNSGLVKIGKHLINFALSVHLPIRWVIRKTIYKHFVGGESISNCSKTIGKLANRQVGSILDYAMEGEESEALFDATCAEVIRTIEFARNNKDIPFSAFKITGIGRFLLLAKKSDDIYFTEEEKAEYQRIYERVDAIFRSGFENKVPVLIDAEHSWIQPAIDEMVMEMMEKYNCEQAIVQNTYQMYLCDAFVRLKQHHQTALKKGFKFGLKIVRGAYMEIERARAKSYYYPSPVHENKLATDQDFNDAIRYFIQHIDTINFMVATHNEASSRLLARLMTENNLPLNHPRIYFSQLYGMSDHITFNLAEKGYNVVKYVPYGEVETMMPYLFRRAEENSSVKGQSSRELTLIETEMKRRKEKLRLQR